MKSGWTDRAIGTAGFCFGVGAATEGRDRPVIAS